MRRCGVSYGGASLEHVRDECANSKNVTIPVPRGRTQVPWPFLHRSPQSTRARGRPSRAQGHRKTQLGQVDELDSRSQTTFPTWRTLFGADGMLPSREANPPLQNVCTGLTLPSLIGSPRENDSLWVPCVSRLNLAARSLCKWAGALHSEERGEVGAVVL